MSHFYCHNTMENKRQDLETGNVAECAGVLCQI